MFPKRNMFLKKTGLLKGNNLQDNQAENLLYTLRKVFYSSETV